MFKNLREKINTVDPNKSKKKSSNNGELTGNENSDEISKNPGSYNLSRFSSLSSLVSDVGSAFTKTMTAPQHIQPTNNLKVYDNESISEFDDSICGGDTCSKEELLQRYQKAQNLVRRFKTRFLEATETCKRLESDNNKLISTLTDSQDKQIRRINELKEEIELDKKAKQDVEENYILMIEEKTEMVNVLKLQVNLLKEGKDLPPELEEQIKKKHEIEVLLERKKQDEIKDLKNTLSQRENLLQRCKDKINSLNSQLNEIKSKFSAVQNMSTFNDDDKIFNDFSLQRGQQLADSKSIEKENNEKIKFDLKELENKQSELEFETKSQLNKKYAEMKFEEEIMKEKIRSLTLENENLQEQFNIKTKIIKDLMEDQFGQSQQYFDSSILSTPLEKLKLCTLIISKYSSSVHPVLDELKSALTSVKIIPTVEMSSSYVGNSEEFTESIVSSKTMENSKLSDLEEQNKCLNSKIEQLEKLKSIFDEEITNRENELLESVSILEAEKKDLIVKNKKYEEDSEIFKNDIKELCLKQEEILYKLSETQSTLNRTEQEKISITEEKNMCLKNSESLKHSLKNLEIVKEKVFVELEKMRNEYSEMDLNFSTKCAEVEKYTNALRLEQNECKNLKDKLDECIAKVNHLVDENNHLLLKLNEKQSDVSNKEEEFSLVAVEMQQRFDQELEELKGKWFESEQVNEKRSYQIKQLYIEIDELKELNDLSKQELENIKNQYRNLSVENESKENLIRNHETFLDNLNKEIESNKLQLEEMTCKLNLCLKENNELINEIEQNNLNKKNFQNEIDSLNNRNRNLMEQINTLSKEIEILTLSVAEKSELLDKTISEKSIINENLLSTHGLLESVQLNLDQLISKQNSLMQENQSIVESLQVSSDENELLKIRSQELELNIDKILQQKEELINNMNNIQKEVDILKICNQELLDSISNIQLEKETLILELSEKSNLLEKENQEKLLLNNDFLTNINSLEYIQSQLSNSINNQNELSKENENKLKEIELLKGQLLDKENLSVRYLKLNEENVTLLEQVETYKNEVENYRNNMIIKSDMLDNLQQEIYNLNDIKVLMEDKLSRVCSENVSITTTLNDEKLAFENSIEKNSKIISELEEDLKNYLMTIKSNEESMKMLQKTIDDNNEIISVENQTISELNSRINFIECYLYKFCGWIEDLANIENCHGDCNQPSVSIHWNSEMESECSDSKILIFLGQSIEKLLSISRQFHTEFHENSKRSIELLRSQSDLQKKLDIIINEIDNILRSNCQSSCDISDNISMKLEFINSTIVSLTDQFSVKSNLLLEIDSQIFKLINALNIDNLSSIDNIPVSFCLNGLEKKIIDIVNYFREDLLIKEENNKKARLEYEKIMDEKSNKLAILMMKMFKQLINIFHLTDIHVNNISDINKETLKNVIRNLKAFAKNHEQLEQDLEDLNIKLILKEKDLKNYVDLNQNIQTELNDLKNSVINDQDRLIATSEELENSMRRLNEVADEKGRIDEEKQSLRKELKELNEKITNLKLEFEKQSFEKERLEMQFDESLDKVKLNHSALEQMYKKELEKQHGYQRNLEEQIASHKESTTLKLSESQKKLEEVLKQSEQLLELNHQYKNLLDEEKITTSEIEKKYLLLDQQNSEVLIQLNLLNSDKLGSAEIINNLKTSLNENSVECDNLKCNIVLLQDEIKNLSENIQKKNEEIEVIKTESDHIKTINETLKIKIDLLESTSDQMIFKEKSILNQSNEILSQKSEFENQISSLQRKIDETEIKALVLNSEKNQLIIQLNEQIKICDQFKIQIGDLKNLVNSYKNQIDDFSLEMEQMKMQHIIDREEIEQQFTEEKLIMEDNMNRKLKKLTKEFSDKIFEKERDFQKTFEEALNSIRKDETRMKSDLRTTIDELNKSTIELQTERNQLLDQISDNDKEIKTLKKIIETKDRDFESMKNELEESNNKINELEHEKQSIIIEKISKMNQTVESSTYYEEPFLGSVAVKDHEVLLMHCSDIEEQLKQLQAENISLRKSNVVNVNDSSLSSISEPVIYASKAKQLSQQSVSSDTSKPLIQHHINIYRSPNTSCSDYTFCPIPITEATDYEYLHDVLLKYMTGMETEILAKVVCTVMKFSNEETSRVLTFEQDRNKFIRRIL